MSLSDRLEIAARGIGRVDGVLLVSFDEPPAEARSWAEGQGIEVIVNPHVRPGTVYLVNPAALGELLEGDVRL